MPAEEPDRGEEVNEVKDTTKTTTMRKIVVRKTGSVRLTARCSNYCYGNCCCL